MSTFLPCSTKLSFFRVDFKKMSMSFDLAAVKAGGAVEPAQRELQILH